MRHVRVHVISVDAVLIRNQPKDVSLNGQFKMLCTILSQASAENNYRLIVSNKLYIGIVFS